MVRVWRPDAVALAVVSLADGARYEVERVHPEGLFSTSISSADGPFPYELEIQLSSGRSARERDPYSFWPVASSYDQYLYNEGTHCEAYRFLGARATRLGGCHGVHFAVWAPAGTRVSVVGDFNRWDGRQNPMRSLGNSGIWELFIPHQSVGTVYKYEIRTAAGEVLLKSDPFAFHAEVPPRTASRVYDIDAIEWSDSEWMQRRAQRDWMAEPMAIYEVHLGSWRRSEHGDALSYREVAHQLVDYVDDLGYTHIELMPVAEHPFAGSWGYQVTGYFAPSARFGSPEDFAYLVNLCHRRNLGVLIDWVPGHFPNDGHGLAQFDGTHLYEHADPRQGVHPDWGTSIFNFGRKEVCSFLLSNAHFWFERYHVDGVRVDAVASMLYLDYSRKHGEWIPNRHGGRENLEAIEFMQEMNKMVYGRFPGAVTIAEESTSWPGVTQPTYNGGLGFGFKWNMGWMNDVLRYMGRDPSHRRYHHSDLTFGMLYAHHENFVLPLSHDEVVHGKGSLLGRMPGDDWKRFANLRLLLAFMYGHPGKKLLFMGGEFGQQSEWDARHSLDWHLVDGDFHGGAQRLSKDLNRLYRTHPSLYRVDSDPGGFEWIDCRDEDSNIVSFRRKSDCDGHEELVFACNFSPIPRRGYRLGLPSAGFHEEVLNTDAAHYGGSDLGNAGGVEAGNEAWHGLDHSAEICLPPLAVVVFRAPS